MNLMIFLLKIIGIKIGDIQILDRNADMIKLNKKINLGIFILISSLPIILIRLDKPSNKKSIQISCIFMIIPIINYLIIINYFRKSYFFKIYTDIIYNECYKKYAWDKIIFITSVGLTLITTIISFIYYLLNYQTISLIYYVDNTFGKIFIGFYILLYNLYSRFIFFFNTIIFFVVFYKHYIDLCMVGDRIKDMKGLTEDQYKLNISLLTCNLLFIRTEINKSINLLEYIYISSTLIGAIGLGAILEYKELNIFLVGTVIIWSVMQIVFLYIISLLTNKKEDLKKIINKPKFCFNYLSRLSNENSIQKLEEHITNKRRQMYFRNNISLCTTNLSRSINIESVKNTEDETIIQIKNNEKNKMLFDTSTSMDWLVLNKILGEDWAVFEFMCVKFENTDGIKKIIGLVALIIYSVKIIINDFTFDLST